MLTAETFRQANILLANPLLKADVDYQRKKNPPRHSCTITFEYRNAAWNKIVIEN